jgi:DNA-binding winged helix-turn-helix (wHTH) protein
MGHSKQSTGEVELDLGRYELRRSGRRVKLEKKPMDLLIFLLERREQMVTRDEIVKRLWRSDLFIDTEKNVNNVVRKLRTALGDNADRPRFLETVVGKGYRFVGPVRVIDAKYPSSEPGRNAGNSEVRRDSSSRAERSSIAVLPLLLLDKTADDQGLCLGFADALVSLLGNLSGVDVLPTSAVLNLPLELAPEQIASRLDVRFVVHGAVAPVAGDA